MADGSKFLEEIRNGNVEEVQEMLKKFPELANCVNDESIFKVRFFSVISSSTYPVDLFRE
jgi:virulence-associated protein VapD